MRWRYLALSSSRRSQEGWTGPPRWNVHHYCPERVGFTGLPSISFVFRCLILKLLAIQVESFEVDLDVPALRNPDQPYTGIFIRAPVGGQTTKMFSTNNHIFTWQVVLKLCPSPEDPPIEVIARLSPNLLPVTLATHSDEPKIFVALRQGRHFLTTFHPELTNDNRFHEYFINECVIGPRWSYSCYGGFCSHDIERRYIDVKIENGCPLPAPPLPDRLCGYLLSHNLLKYQSQCSQTTLSFTTLIIYIPIDWYVLWALLPNCYLYFQVVTTSVSHLLMDNILTAVSGLNFCSHMQDPTLSYPPQATARTLRTKYTK